MAIVTLTTDFGLTDEYAGVMKGVILSVNPALSVVDLTHGIDPQDIRQAAHLLSASFRYFPSGSVHVGVVDPGVGGKRRICCMKAGGHLFVAPDNGILSKVADEENADLLVHVKNRKYFLPLVSGTFHGRDIMAPVAAHLASGLMPERLGPVYDQSRMVRLPREKGPAGEGCGYRGTIIAVDRFGNLITDIRIKDIEAKGNGKNLRVRAGDITVSGIGRTYSDVSPGEPIALFGSRGYLEISVNCGDAERLSGAGKGAPVTVTGAG